MPGISITSLVEETATLVYHPDLEPAFPVVDILFVSWDMDFAVLYPLYYGRSLEATVLGRYLERAIHAGEGVVADLE
ncbi:unnamed protein product [Linum trigynum]|uniref:Uncharacterized protein n=1 Tax=Linum trigynum TaxID=586398 RepID=A0AAV2CSY5_9ROSI